MGAQQSTEAPAPVTSVSFTLNGDPVTVEGATPWLTLNEWIRTQPGLSGTKKMCGEGGCGCCVVAVTHVDPVTQMESTIAVNSCLCPLYSVDGWHITTVEGIGSSSTEYHPIQQRIAEYNGSQCGYCTPGFVMNMYSLLQENPNPTRQQIEDHFDGNICRCTGYRSILDAMKSFAVDPSKGGPTDIEDGWSNVGSPKVCPLSGKPCKGGGLCRRVESDPEWYRPTSLSDLFGIIGTHPDSNVKLVGGDTGRGVFKTLEEIDVFIDMKGISDLYKTEVTASSLTVGGSVPLSNLIGVLTTNQEKSVTFEHLVSHLLKIANVPVRNVGTWAGNLMLTHDHDNFPSDVFTMMAAAGASITIAYLTGSSTWGSTTLSLWDFLKRDMKNSVIVSMEIPFAASDVVFRSFKTMPVAQCAHAYVNAAFSIEVDSTTFIVKDKPSLVFGGIDTHSISASETESYLSGKNLRDPNTLKGALESLEKEIAPNSSPPAASPQYRKSLAISLFYKFYLAAIGGHISPAVKSASYPYKRPVSQGSQSYSTNPSEYPVTEPRTKLTALLQATGEAEYTTDVPTRPAEVAAAFVLTTLANAKITSMDFSVAEKMPGCLKIITAADIPPGGENNFLPAPIEPQSAQEKVLVTEFSDYAGQPVAIVIADTQQNANMIAGVAAAGVKYESAGKPILTIQEAIAAGSFFPPGTSVLQVGDAKSAISGSAHVIEGEVAMGTQYHFHMETQTTLCIPEDDGYMVYSSSQWPSLGQAAVANVLGIPTSSVNVSVKRCGGAFGAKITCSHWIAAGTALASYIIKRPVRMHMDIDTNMRMIGKRFPYYATYTIGCTDEGILNGIEATVYTDGGSSDRDSSIHSALFHIDNAYHVPNWLVIPKSCKTNTPSNTACRSPGTLPGIFISEAMINHVATALGLDVEDVKRKNLYQKGQVTPAGMVLTYCNISTLWDQLYKSADVANRKKEVEEFNKSNRWRRRGITMVPLKFGIYWDEVPYSAHVSIYRNDGTVAIAHGGIEIGQGINTKVAQVAAKTLGIPIELIRIKPTNTLISPNDQATGGSTTSELCSMGVINACKDLNSRIDPVRQKYPDATWQELIELCYNDGLDLAARYYVFNKTAGVYVYNSYGVTCTEVEVDVLTGETQILRVDILEDCGESINPEIDIGQVEGAFVMGLGYWLTEKVVYDGDSGQLLTHNTWEYKPPTSKDIPIDFRVELLKNAPNPLGVLGSKAVGEPPTCMSCSALFAVKKAVESARADIGKGGYFPLDGPATVEDIQQACLVDPSQFIF